MKKDNGLIHLKFDYLDALESVRELLYVQKSTMIIAKKMKMYSSLKKEKEKMKIKLKERVADAKNVFMKMQKNLPQVKTAKMTSKPIQKEMVRETTSNSEKSIEDQLYDIQSKLNSLSR